MDIHVNYWAVLAAAAAYFTIGWVWHSPMMFGKTWMKLMGFSKLSKKEQEKMKANMGRALAFNFLATLLTSYVMAYSVGEVALAYHISGMVLAISTGFWIWLGFIATTQLNTVLWEGRPFKLYLINVGYYLVSYLVVATILVTWP